MSEHSTPRAAATVSIIFAVSALLGFFREVVLAAYFGTSPQTDALLVAMVIPNFFSDLLGEAALAAAIVPVFMSVIAPKARDEQKAIIGSTFALVSLLLVPLTLLTMLAAPTLARLFAPGFDPDRTTLTIALMRVMLPSVFFLGLANLVTGVLYAHRRFGAAAATSAMWNVAIIVLTVPLAHRYGIVAPALGVLVGSVLQLAIMLPPLVRTGLFPAVGFRFADPTIRRMWTLFWPILGGALLAQVFKTADKIIASFLPAGSIAALSYADKIAGGPARIFAMAVSVVLFPSFAQKVSEKAEDLATSVASGITSAAALTLPWAAIFIALREPIVSVLLERGAFDARATAMVAVPMAIYCLGEFADGITTMVNNAYYSHEDSRTPTVMNIVAKIVRIVVALAFLRLMSYNAIALGAVVSMNFLLIALLVMLRRKVADLDLARIGVTLARLALASAGAAGVAWLVFRPLAALLGPLSTLSGAAALAASCIPALVIYSALGWALRVEEVQVLLRRGAALAWRSR